MRSENPREPSWKPPIAQPPFISSSTPIRLQQRFMKWNQIGIIRQYQTEEEQSIEIEFIDTTQHYPMNNIDNSESRYTMADLSQDAVALASFSTDQRSSTLTVYHFSGWDSASSEWSVVMPTNESIQVCNEIWAGRPPSSSLHFKGPSRQNWIKLAKPLIIP